MTPIDTKLYELFADKTLSEGCLLSTDHGERKWDEYFLVGEESLYRESRNGNEPYLFSKTFQIIGHEPQLHDVFRVAKEKGIFLLVQTEDFNNYYIGLAGESLPYREIPYNPTISLIAQTDETKQALIDLFSNN